MNQYEGERFLTELYQRRLSPDELLPERMHALATEVRSTIVDTGKRDIEIVRAARHLLRLVVKAPGLDWEQRSRVIGAIEDGLEVIAQLHPNEMYFSVRLRSTKATPRTKWAGTNGGS